MAGGIVVLADQSPEIFAHERMHVVQMDFFKTSVGFPLEDWVRNRIGIDRWPAMEHFLMGFGYLIVEYPLSGVGGPQNDYFEVEAKRLGGR